jgi:drug/metabolite transporter superfamily protein YnfA
MSLGSWVRKLWLAVLGALTALLMVRDWLQDPFNPTLQDTARYGHNGEGTLGVGVVAVLIELAVLHAVLQPWRHGRSAGWTALALLLLVPWGLVSALMSMHTGGIVALHFSWIFVVTAVLFIMLAVAGIKALSRRARS